MKDETIAVRLPVNLGVRFCGPYKAGEIYQVEVTEAERLISYKRFERVDEHALDDQEQEI